MIDAKIQELSALYLDYWSRILEGHPRYKLDFSWPSIGTVQLTLSHLIGQQNLGQNEQNLIAGAAAYLGVLAHQSWNVFGEGTEISLVHREETLQEIVLTAQGGKFLEKSGTYSIDIAKALRAVLLGPTRAYEKYTQEILPREFLLTCFSCGLLTGLCPLGAGPWAERAEEDAKNQLAAAELALAATCASYYRVTYPSDETGFNSKLYIGGAVLPPIGYREKFFGARGAFSLLQRLRESEADLESIATVGLNLAQNPNLQLAAAGYSVAVAACGTSMPSKKLILLSDSFDEIKLVLKGAIALSRKLLEVPDSLSTLLQQDQREEAQKLLDAETALGLAPLFRIKLDEALTVPNLANRLYWMQAESARQAIDEVAKNRPLDAAAALQGIVLDVALGQFERARAELQDSNKNRSLKTITSGHLLSLRDELIGFVALHARELELAASMFKNAANHPGIEQMLRARLLALAADCLTQLGKYEEALDTFEKSVAEFPAVLPRLQMLRVAAKLGEEIDPEILNQILIGAPHNSDAFQMLVAVKQMQLGPD